MNREELLELADKLDFSDFSKLFKFWLEANAGTLKFDDSQALLFMAISMIKEAHEANIVKYREHAMNAECAGAEMLMGCKKLAVMERAKVFVDRFKDESFNNYRVWFYERYNKLKGESNE